MNKQPIKYRAIHSHVRWDTKLITALSQTTGMSAHGLKLCIKDLADKLDFKLPQWSDKEVTT